jgi:hypothetical protein
LPESAGITSVHNPRVNAGNENVAYKAVSIADCSEAHPEKGVCHNIDKIIVTIPIR